MDQFSTPQKCNYESQSCFSDQFLTPVFVNPSSNIKISNTNSSYHSSFSNIDYIKKTPLLGGSASRVKMRKKAPSSPSFIRSLFKKNGILGTTSARRSAKENNISSLNSQTNSHPKNLYSNEPKNKSHLNEKESSFNINLSYEEEIIHIISTSDEKELKALCCKPRRRQINGMIATLYYNAGIPYEEYSLPIFISHIIEKSSIIISPIPLYPYVASLY